MPLICTGGPVAVRSHPGCPAHDLCELRQVIALLRPSVSFSVIEDSRFSLLMLF